MAHIEDRWFTPQRDDDGKLVLNARGKPVMARTPLYGTGLRYRVRYIGPDGRERKKSFPDRAKQAAEAFMATVEADKHRGSFIDPAAGRMLFGEFAETWLRTRTYDKSTMESLELRVRKHILPFFGSRPLASIKPSAVAEWDSELAGVLAQDTRSVAFAYLRMILTAAVDDERIAENPCSAKSVKQPRPVERRVVPWTYDEISAIRANLLPRYRPVVDLGGGCGMRQGEIFGLGVDDVDLDGGWVHVRRQVKRVNSRLVFGLPKNDKDRRVPLPTSIAAPLRAHLAEFPTVKVTLPWEDPFSDELVTVPLVFVTSRRGAINRSHFNSKIWHPALAAVGIPHTRATGVHALRHFYASTLLDAGENVRALATYLGHADPGFTLRIYTHLMPSSEERTHQAIDALFASEAAMAA
ncbi:tyrosine-type recombinase/integrase [Cryptosporangium sp. NPDC048952]|uniref:tyrosine-type recombinase/integrase n=1 Tax=Cryptosporangium sp. NPDC048952 TaxID=3363961 RepID=UPI00370FACBB